MSKTKAQLTREVEALRAQVESLKQAEAERERAQEQLEESEERYRDIVELAPDGIATVDLRGVVTSCNTAFLELSGYSEDEIVGRHFTKLPTLPMRDLPTYIKMFETLVRGKSDYMEFRWLHKDGTLRWGEAHASRMIKGGKVIGLQAILRDTTERKRTEGALRESEEEYHSLTTRLPIGVYRTDREGRILYANPALAKILGYDSVEELTTTTTAVERYADPRDREAFLEQRAKHEGTLQHEALLQRRDGTQFWARDVGRVVLNDRGEIEYNEGTLEDITERKQAEEAIRESEEKFRSLAEQSPNMIFINQAGGVVYANKKCKEATGYDREEFYAPDFDFLTLIAPEYVEVIEASFERHMRGEEVDPYEYALISKDGRRVEAIIATKLIAYEGDRAILGIVTDITGRKRAEEALQRYTERLKAMHEIDRDILEARSPEEIAQTATQHLRQLLACKFATVAVFDFEASEAVILSRAPAEDSPYPPGSRLPMRTGPQVFEKLRRGEAHVIEDIELLPSPSPTETALQSEGVRAFVTLPLLAGKQLIGSLNFGANTPGPFPPEHLEIAREVANPLAIAIQQARLHEQAQRRAAELEALRQATLDISAQLDLDTLLETLTESALELLGVRSGGIYLYRPERDVLEWAVKIGTDPVPLGTELQRGEGLSGKVWESGEPISVDDYGSWEGRAQKYEGYTFEAIVGVPIRWGDEFLGVALGDMPRRTFSEDGVRLLSLFADQAAIAIVNARLFEAERRERVLAQNLQQSAEALVRSAHLEDTLSLIVNQLGAVVPFDRALVMLAEGDDLRIVASQGSLESAEIIGKTYHYPDVPLLHAALGHEGALVVQNMQQDPRGAELPGDIASEGTWVGVRLIVWETVMGLLTIGSQEPDFYEAQDVDAVTAFAHQAALAMEHARIVRELESRVADLQEAQTHLMRAARLSATGEIAAGVAHQINNPLTTVILESDMLLQELKTDHPGYESAQAIHEAAERAGTVTTRLLDLSRLEPLSMKLLNVNDSLQNAVALVRSQVEPTIRLATELAPHLPLIQASQQHIEDVWINLLLNAKYAVRDVEGGIIRVSSALHVKGQSIIVTIKDNGVGIPAEHLDRVFDPFFTIKTEPHGIGLGLSVCHDIVTRHGGSIQVESKEGQGTTFVVTLPLGRGSVVSSHSDPVR